jgi:hypothetical protein
LRLGLRVRRLERSQKGEAAGSRWLMATGEGALGDTQERGSTAERGAWESGGRFTEVTKMPILRRRQSGVLEKIASIRSASGIASFGFPHPIIFNGIAYNLSQTGP